MTAQPGRGLVRADVFAASSTPLSEPKTAFDCLVPEAQESTRVGVAVGGHALHQWVIAEVDAADDSEPFARGDIGLVMCRDP